MSGIATMRAQVSSVGMVKNIAALCPQGASAKRARSVQRPVDLLGQLARDAVDAGQVLDAGIATPRTPPKRCSSRARFFGPTPAMSSSRLPPVRTRARRARMPVMAKRCASSRICATSISAAESWPSDTFGAAVGEHQFLEADLAALALLHADDQRQVQAQFREHLARHADLAAPAVDQHQVGQARAAVAGVAVPDCSASASLA